MIWFQKIGAKSQETLCLGYSNENNSGLEFRFRNAGREPLQISLTWRTRNRMCTSISKSMVFFNQNLRFLAENPGKRGLRLIFQNVAFIMGKTFFKLSVFLQLEFLHQFFFWKIDLFPYEHNSLHGARHSDSLFSMDATFYPAYQLQW